VKINAVIVNRIVKFAFPKSIRMTRAAQSRKKACIAFLVSANHKWARDLAESGFARAQKNESALSKDSVRSGGSDDRPTRSTHL
jgi:hypothetical protein